MACAVAILRLRYFPLLQPRALSAALPRHYSVLISTLPRHYSAIPEPLVSAAEATARTAAACGGEIRGLSHPSLPKQEANSSEDLTDCRHWKEKEGEILQDIEPIKFRTKDILHTDRYRDGERLSTQDEQIVVEKLLAYHPHAEDKIGCGMDYIMVDRHPQFKNSRCLFVVRTDGVWIDFSYQKCLRVYIKEKYPSHAERFIKEHFKRT